MPLFVKLRQHLFQRGNDRASLVIFAFVGQVEIP